jgi:hypothetical protein
MALADARAEHMRDAHPHHTATTPIPASVRARPEHGLDDQESRADPGERMPPASGGDRHQHLMAPRTRSRSQAGLVRVEFVGHQQRQR